MHAHAHMPIHHIHNARTHTHHSTHMCKHTTHMCKHTMHTPHKHIMHTNKTFLVFWGCEETEKIIKQDSRQAMYKCLFITIQLLCARK